MSPFLFAVLLLQPASVQSTTPLGPHDPAHGRAPLIASVSGVVRASSTLTPIAGARITLFTPALTVFRETRSAADGSYSLSELPAGAYQLGAEALGRDYAELSIVLGTTAQAHDFTLAPETHPGAWNVIGDTSPEVFDGTDIGILRPNGTLMYCHDTMDPVIFNPVTGVKSFPPGSGTEQGCMNGTLLENGSVLMVGGQSPSDPGSFTNAVPWVKRFSLDGQWFQQQDMLLSVGRWYPGLARLNDGRLLIMGGGTSPSAVRTDTCEIYTPATASWAFTDTMNSPLEFPPNGLLYNGKVLRTWGTTPELFDPATQQWIPTGGFVFPNRGFPGHSDHSLLILSDGRALAVGINRMNQPTAAMSEFYSPASGTWSAGTSPSLARMQCEIVYMPDGRVFVGAGDQQTTAGPEPNVLGIVKRCDIFDPTSLAWRRVVDMLAFREYHGVTLLVPDGRVVTTGGTRIKFQVGPTTNNIEAWSPPYLFRGVRPQISGLSSTTPVRGETLTFQVFPTTKITSCVLMGAQSTTHWVDGGIPRRLVLPFTQAGTQVTATLPTEADLVPTGWYMIFALVDDIPSKALILRVRP